MFVMKTSKKIIEMHDIKRFYCKNEACDDVLS